ncbi:MAG TPA: hypothetical protein VGI39_25970 [Polyangiaceae bacterium]
MRLGLPLGVLGALGFAAAAMPACSSSSPTQTPPPPPAGDSGSGSYTGAANAPCVGQPGGTPNPECDDGDETTCVASTACSVAASCGDKTTCLPMTDNSASAVKNFRMRRLIIVSPSTLANQTIQNIVVTSGVDMGEPQCGEEGTGDFSWLLSLDTSNNTLTTGGAPPCDTINKPACDPFNTGYCFVNKNVGSIPVAPVSGAMIKNADGTYSSTPGAIPTLNVPIYFQGSIIVLPISDGAISGMKLSDNGNCIGSFNADALVGANCADNYQNCSKWKTDGTLTGYITLEAADTVVITNPIKETLCAALTGSMDPNSPNKGCPRDASGKISAMGDYCSTTKAPGGCLDSSWLAATFAASAVKINAGNTDPDCAGGTADGGSTPTDSGSAPADAAGE